MGNPLDSIGNALHHVASGIRDVAAGFASGERPQANPAPQAPDPWLSDWAKTTAEQQSLARREAAAKAQGAELSNQTGQLSLDSMKRQEKVYTDLGDAINRWKAATDPIQKQNIRSEIELTLSQIRGYLPPEKQVNPGVALTRAMYKLGIAPGTPLTPELMKQIGDMADQEATKTVTSESSSIDPVTGLPVSRSETRITKPGGAPSTPSAPSGSGVSSAPSVRAASKSGRHWPEQITSAYDAAIKGTWPKESRLVDAMNRYAVSEGLPLPIQVSPTLKQAIPGLNALESTLPNLEKYSNVLADTKSSLKLRRLSESAMKSASGKEGLGVGGFVGAGIDKAVANSLTPDEKGFLIAYNAARDAVQSMRPFLGSTRSTQQLYQALLTMLPNPVQTSDAAMAKQQIAQLRSQIGVIKQSLGMGGQEASPNAPVPTAPNVHPSGFVPDKE